MTSTRQTAVCYKHGVTDWNPALYTRFEDERTRPARDLLGRVPLDSPMTVVDLGCGPGNSTELLAARFPEATITGFDSSPAMIAAARERLPTLRFAQADIAGWSPAEAPDLIFANAVLQWLPDHETLIPRLFGMLAPGGVLAVQMPDNLDEASHRAMRTVAAEEPWAARLQPVVARRDRLPPLATYYDWLVARGATVDLWRTAYQHPLTSPAAIVDWVSSTGLRPFLDALDGSDREVFRSRYEALIDRDYPARADGTRLLAFPRAFIVAARQARERSLPSHLQQMA